LTKLSFSVDVLIESELLVAEEIDLPQCIRIDDKVLGLDEEAHYCCQLEHRTASQVLYIEEVHEVDGLEYHSAVIRFFSAANLFKEPVDDLHALVTSHLRVVDLGLLGLQNREHVGEVLFRVVLGEIPLAHRDEMVFSVLVLVAEQLLGVDVGFQLQLANLPPERVVALLEDRELFFFGVALF